MLTIFMIMGLPLFHACTSASDHNMVMEGGTVRCTGVNMNSYVSNNYKVVGDYVFIKVYEGTYVDFRSSRCEMQSTYIDMVIKENKNEKSS